MKNTALITGASGGIGKELSYVFARHGHDLLLVARNKEKLTNLAVEIQEKYQRKVTIYSIDLSDPSAAKALFEWSKQQQIQIDYLVNNAGFGDYGYFLETSWDKELQMINLNITSLTALTKFFAADMAVRKSGRIMNLGSVASFMPGPLMAVYYATKNYVLAFSEAIVHELKNSGVTVTTLCPGPTTSGFQERAQIQDSPLVKGKKLPTSLEVAEYGYKQMMKGKYLAIPGISNKLMVTFTRLSSRKMVTKLVKKVTEKPQ